MGIAEYQRKPTIFSVVKRGAFFFFLMCSAAVFLYILGTFQQFTDLTQRRLLRLAGFFGLFLSLNSLYGILMDFWFFFRKGRYRVLSDICLYAFLGLFGSLAAALTLFINVLAGGRG